MRTIYFFTSPSCGSCEEWKPVIEEFIANNLGKCIPIRLNPNFREYEYRRSDGRTWTVKYTPSVMVQENGKLLRYAEGKLMTLAELEAFAFDDAVDVEQETEDDDDEEEEEELEDD